MERTGLSRPTIYKAMIANRFPASVKFGSATMWVVHEIERWIQERITQSRC
jgi:predicted DNA-binding transcriptional regulator AlpA